MQTSNRTSHSAGRLLARILFIGLSIAAAMAVTLPASAANTVPVDQQPLVVRPNVPPNVVLMLDDSGSMDRNYMPDGSSHEEPNSYINGVYYNPNVIYTPPPKADGSSYPESPGLGNAYKDGFKNHHTTDVTDYHDHFDYYEELKGRAGGKPYDPTPGCKEGDKLMENGPHAGQCQHDDTDYSEYPAHKKCTAKFYGYCFKYEYTCDDGDTMEADGRTCQHVKSHDYSYYKPTHPTCPQGGNYDSGTGKCVTPAGKRRTVQLFVYSTKDSNGNYVKHYVGKSASDCYVAINNGYDCDSSAKTRQNVANWFSYYRTRMLMAKSGVMQAFSNLDPKFRIGFASIHNNGGFPKGVATTTSVGKKLAEVEPFGSGASSSSQKSKFWDWISDAKADNGTPLRQSLQAVGEYYETKQPWESRDKAGQTQMLACRQSYVILTTDGFWNGNDPYGIGNTDGHSGPIINGPNNNVAQYTPKKPYEDSDSRTLADVAMHYWNHDLARGGNTPDIKNEVPTSDTDKAFWQHMVTFTMGMGFKPTGISPKGTTVDEILGWANGGDSIKGFSWPSPSSDDLYKITDLAHAAVNGHGGYFSATDPVSFANGLSSALDRAKERAGTGASLAANSTQLKTGSVAYQAIYHTQVWTGQLEAFSLNSVSGAIADNANWDAATEMPKAADRDIWTWDASNDKPVKFEFASLPSSLKNALGTDGTKQKAMVGYLRGSHAKELDNGGNFRNRTTVLGDIVDSEPVYVGAPATSRYEDNTGMTGASTYQSWANGKQSRAGVVYIAANDGMVHAFNADTGKEIFAFMPAAVIKDGIKKLASLDYGKSADPHEYFNDGKLNGTAVYMNGAWHTILVGTTGRGKARAVYALDVTDPGNISVLWEHSAAQGGNYGYIGQITGKPVVTQVSNGDWVALMGNGYNSPKGTSALLQFNLSDGTLQVYKTGTGTGLAAPGVWIGDVPDNVSTQAYAGDLNGNVWQFNLGKTGGSVSGGQVEKLFTAKSGSTAQPITTRLTLGFNSKTGNRWVFFGTGRYLSKSDVTDTDGQSWYGLVVKKGQNTNLKTVNASMGQSDLAQRKIEKEILNDASNNGLSIRTLTGKDSKDKTSMQGKAGWYYSLQDTGERMISSNQFEGNLLIGTSIVPQSKDPCNPSGRGWIMAINPFTGLAPDHPVFNVTTKDGKPAAGLGYTSMPNAPIFVGNSMLVSFSNATTTHQNFNPGGGLNAGRVSWREMVNQ